MIAAQLTKPIEPEVASKLRKGELIRLYERTFSRRGTYQVLVVMTSSKAFVKTTEWANSIQLSAEQAASLKQSLTGSESVKLRAKKRASPMWPSAYDAPDEWLAYRVGSTSYKWTNHDYENPGDECGITKLIREIREQATPKL